MRQKNELRPYQDRIATHLYENDEAMMVVRPGGGKTITALTAITELLRDKVIRHALVIAPKRVARVVWPDEIDSWAHTEKLKYAILDGPPGERETLLRSRIVDQRDITIIGIDLIPWLIKAMSHCPADSPLFDLLVIDEVSRLRKPDGVRAKDLAKHAGKWRMIWGLSGTLRPSSAEDLFMPSRIVTRGKLWGRSFHKWRKDHFRPIDFQGYEWTPLAGAEDKLNAEIAPLVATVADGELVQPEPTIVIDRVQLPPAARRQYDNMNRLLMAQADEQAIVAASTGVATGKMAQIANGFLYGEGKRPIPSHSAKREWLEDVIENATGPTLLIYDFNSDLTMLRDALGEDLPYLGAGVSDAQAGQNIMMWNRGLLPFMGLHPASGGHGLNLQHGGADMAWIAPTWSPEYWEQTIARLNRSGQQRQVIVRVCVADNTVDDLKLDRVHHKMTAQEAFEAYLRRWQTHN